MGDSAPNENAGDDDGPSQAEAELGAAVDEALAEEVKRQKARFVQEIMGLDRMEGVGRSQAELEDRQERARRAYEADRDTGKDTGRDDSTG